MHLFVQFRAVYFLALIAVIPFQLYGQNSLMVFEFSTGADERQWESKVLDNTFARTLVERAPKGESFDPWVEKIENQVLSSPATLNNFMKVWVLQQKIAFPDFKVIQSIPGSQSLVLIYQVPSEDIVAIRKFMRAADGIYMMAYQVREKSLNYKTYAIWLENIKAVKLVKNPDLN